MAAGNHRKPRLPRNDLQGHLFQATLGYLSCGEKSMSRKLWETDRVVEPKLRYNMSAVLLHLKKNKYAADSYNMLISYVYIYISHLLK